MPIIRFQVPIYDRLPLILYDGVFQLWTEPDIWGKRVRPCGYYFSPDRTWHATPDHILGWSRELIHCLKSSAWTKRFWAGTKPDWLLGHAFQNESIGRYRVSGTNRVYPEAMLISMAEEAIEAFTPCEITLDQHGGTEHRHFLSAIQLSLSSNGNQHRGFLQSHIQRHGYLDAWIQDQNYRNALWHPRYPIQGPLNASGIGQTYCNSILNAAFQAGTFTGAATIYNALHSAAPSDTSDGTEAAYTGYARQSITCNSTNFPNASAGTITYSPQITYPTNTGSSETEVATSWQAASSGGTQPNWWGGFSSTAVGTGIAPIFNNNALITSGV